MRSIAVIYVILKLSLPLNIRCSNRWAKPVLPGFSFLDPTWYHVFTATMGALWSSCTSTVRPLLSTNLVYLMSGMGMLTLAVAGAFALASGLGCANEDAAPKKDNATTANRVVTRCINLFLKAFLHMKDQILN